jgi:GxxExxY protein
MNTDQHRKDQYTKFLHKELGYQLQGCFFEIRKNYGPGQKELVYVNLIAEWFKEHKIPFEKEKSIKIYSINSGKVVGTYKPDFLVDNKILLEIKSSRVTIKQDEKQLYFYLRNSPYEVGYLVNFSTPRLYIKRIIYTNERKPFLQKISV